MSHSEWGGTASVHLRLLSAACLLGAIIFVTICMSTAPASAQRAKTGYDRVLEDPRICWIVEERDPNGGWGQLLYSEPSHFPTDFDVSSALGLGLTPSPGPDGKTNFVPAHGQVVKQGDDIYIQPSPYQMDQLRQEGRRITRLRKVPCPETPTNTAGYVGVEILKNAARVQSTEKNATTGATTNQFSDSGDPIGGGLTAGYNFRFPSSRFFAGPYVSFDWLKQTVNHTFTGGSFLGTTTNWLVSLGGKFGVTVMPQLDLYGLAGVTWLNQSLNVNFATSASRTTTTPGFTLGLGAEYKPDWHVPVSLFLQYQHTWYSDADFNTPSSSPAFNYTFKRDDDTVKLGANFYFWR